MNDQLLQTKLYHPRLPSTLVPRPKLIQLLDEGLAYGRKLAFVYAPAGFGKTTLVAEWIHTMDRPVGWLSLDEGDNDPSRFLAYFIAALQSIGPELVEVANAALGSPQPVPMEAVLTVVINSITRCSAPLALVLDDYHLIEAQAVHKMLAFLLDHQPPELHLVIITRAEGPGPAAGGGARG